MPIGWHLVLPRSGPTSTQTTSHATMTRYAHLRGFHSIGRRVLTRANHASPGRLVSTLYGALSVAIGMALLASSAVAAPAAPFQCTADNLEDNDTCATALPISTPFSRAGLSVMRTDSDFYSLTVLPGEEVQVDIFFTHLTADVDLFLYDQNGSCGGPFTFLARSDSSSNDESARWLNTGSSPVDVAIQVLVFPGSLTPCNNYDIPVSYTHLTLPTICSV